MQEQKMPQGVIIEEPNDKDWKLGSAEFGKEILVPGGDWAPYLPTHEKQRKGYETMACTNFSSTSAIEIYFTYLIKNKKISVGNLNWLKENGYLDVQGFVNFSDRFDALVSGTGPNGNSLKAPAEAKRKYGLIPEGVLPWTSNYKDYFDKNKITQEMFNLGLEFLKRFSINYEFVYSNKFVKGLEFSPLAGACYAWSWTKDGIYQRSDGRINHAICKIKPPRIWHILDSYDPFIKKLANNYKFLHYAIRYIIRENVTEEQEDNSMSLKTIKFETDPRIFIVSPNDEKELLWIHDDDDNSSWDDYKFFVSKGFIKPFETVNDALLPNYKILGGMMKVDFGITDSATTLSWWQRIKSWFS